MLTDLRNDEFFIYSCTLFFSIFSIDDFSEEFDVFSTNNIVHDYSSFTQEDPINIANSAGTVILPEKEGKRIVVLFQSGEWNPAIVAHELCHVYDFLMFASYYCNNQMYKVKNHVLYETYILWSEFHAKLYEIIDAQYAGSADMTNPFAEFRKDAQTFYYPRYIENFNNKQYLTLHDFMWHFAEIAACNLLDDDNEYDISSDLKREEYNGFYDKMYNLLFNMVTFQDFVNHAEEFQNLFSKH